MISTLDHPVREAKILLSYYIYCEPNASKHDCDILQNCVLYYVSIQFWNYAFIENNKTYVHSFGTSRSWTNLSQYESSNPSSSSGHTIPRVTYRRLEKIASYHYLPRVVLYSNNGTLKKSQSHQNFAARERNDGSNTQWEI